MSTAGPEREKYLRTYPACAVCGKFASEVHEICRGASRDKALLFPQAWLSTCRKCHDGELSTASIPRQLALKFLQSPEFYDRVMVNTIRGRAIDAVSELEVLIELDRWHRERP